MMLTPSCWSSSTLTSSSAVAARNMATPPPGTIPFLDRRFCGVHGVLDTGLLFLHFRFRGRTDFDHGYAAHELRESLLKLLAVIVRRGVLDLRAELFDAAFDGLLCASAFDDRRVVLVDRYLLRCTQILELEVLELEAQGLP